MLLGVVRELRKKELASSRYGFEDWWSKQQRRHFAPDGLAGAAESSELSQQKELTHNPSSLSRFLVLHLLCRRIGEKIWGMAISNRHQTSRLACCVHETSAKMTCSEDIHTMNIGADFLSRWVPDTWIYRQLSIKFRIHLCYLLIIQQETLG